MAHLGEKLKELRVSKGLGQSEMADFLEVGYRSYQEIEKTGVVKKSDVLSRIFEKTGITDTQNFVNDTAASYLTARRDSKNKALPFTAPLVPVKARAGYVSSYDQTDYINTLETYALPPGVNPVGAVWRYFEIDGDSMEPTFTKGDIVLASMVLFDDWQEIRNFYIYVVVTDSQVLIKRLYRKTAKMWVMISDNEESYDQEPLQVDTIKELWVFRRKINSKAPPPKKFEIKI